MISALPAPGPAALVTQWAVQPVAVVVLAGLTAWYASAVVRLRRRGRPWSTGRCVTFAIGIVAAAWTTCGFLQAYLPALFWVWTTRQLTLLLVVPLLVLAGGPLQLARLVHGDRGLVAGFLRSPVARVLANPLIGPAVVPLASVVLFFGPLPGWAIGTPAIGWLLDVVLVVVGALIVLPLIGLDDRASSLAVGLSLAIGSLELVLDAVPGIVLRLHNTVATSYFAHRTLYAFSPHAITDQRTAGSILWCVSEVIDLPFLLLVYRRWVRADERDAAEIDAVLEAERIARGVGADPAEPGTAQAPTTGSPAVPADTPWWVNDPTMQQRLRRRD